MQRITRNILFSQFISILNYAAKTTVQKNYIQNDSTKHTVTLVEFKVYDKQQFGFDNYCFNHLKINKILFKNYTIDFFSGDLLLRKVGIADCEKLEILNLLFTKKSTNTGTTAL